MSSLKDKTVKGVIWSAVDRFSAQGIQFVFSILIARLLVPEDYGVIAMLNIFLAVSQTFIDISGLFSKGFVEPGYVYIMASTNHERLYSQGLLREDTKRDRFEFYSPEFNNLGDQAIKNKSLYF